MDSFHHQTKSLNSATMTQITIQLLNLNDNLTSRGRLYDRWRDKNHRAKRVYVQIHGNRSIIPPKMFEPFPGASMNLAVLLCFIAVRMPFLFLDEFGGCFGCFDAGHVLIKQMKA